MNRKEIKPGSVYLTYDIHDQLYHVSRLGAGTTGFLSYIRGEIYEVLKNSRLPSLWLAHYDFPDSRNIPPIRPDNIKYYLDELSDAAVKHGGTMRHTVNMQDALFCYLKKIVPLTPAAERPELALNPDYPQSTEGYGAHIPQPDAYLPEYRAYLGIETHDGVVLFSDSQEGKRQQHAFEEYIESNFMDTSVPEGRLRYHEIIADPLQIQSKVDRLKFSDEHDLSKGLKKACVKPDILKQGHLTREFDLTKTLWNRSLFQKRDEITNPRPKNFLDRTMRDFFSHFIERCQNANHPRVECLQNSHFPGEDRIITLKIKR